MICPACKNEMVIVEHDNIELDYCTECRGVWFDSGELELLLASAGMESSAPFLDDIVNHAEADSAEKKRKCPICIQKMKKVFIGEILVDICRREHGIWFDGGEMGHLLTLLAQKSPEQLGTQAQVMSFLGEVFQLQK